MGGVLGEAEVGNALPLAHRVFAGGGGNKGIGMLRRFLARPYSARSLYSFALRTSDDTMISQRCE